MRLFRAVTILGVVSCFGVARSAHAQTPVGTSLTFQGQLNENGQPANAEYDFQFRLFNAASGGAAISQILTVGDLPVENGVFSRELDFVPMPNKTLFDGDNRWIEVAVRPGNSNGAYTTLTPRQKLTAAPYAVYALGGSGGGDGFWASNGNDIHSTNAGRVGIHTASPQGLLEVNGEGNSELGLRLYHPGASTGEIQFGGPAGSPGITGLANNGNRRDIRFSDLGLFLLSNDSPDRPSPTRGMFIGESGDVGIGTYEPTARLEINGEGSAAIGLVLNQPGSSTGRVEIGSPTGYPGIVTFTNSGNRRDIRFTDLGIFLLTSNSPSRPGASTGLFIDEAGQVGAGTYEPAARMHVVQAATGTAGLFESTTSFGLDGYSASNTGTGVRGRCDNGIGVTGISSTGRAGFFFATSASNSQPALDVVTVGNSSSRAIRAVNSGTGHAGHFEINNGNSSGTALYCTTSGTGLALQADAIARVDVLEIVGADIAEKFPVVKSKTATPGTVMEIDPDRPGHLRVASGAYSPGVAGVVSGANDLSVGAVLGNLPGHEDAPPIALSGRAWVKCDASNGPIEPNDLLTTSNTPGHAMKAADRGRAYGATIGKAMSSLKEGKGLVLVLVSLQ
ncbi:MAG: hypothetical protein C4547_15360 [Phycisphaerales bacterium]|nr:MAG: hypothetical protein C4547_15360 [Phycisphaerales bacterium]